MSITSHKASCNFFRFRQPKATTEGGGGGGGGDYQTLAALLDFTSKTWGIPIEKQINKFFFAE